MSKLTMQLVLSGIKKGCCKILVRCTGPAKLTCTQHDSGQICTLRRNWTRNKYSSRSGRSILSFHAIPATSQAVWPVLRIQSASRLKSSWLAVLNMVAAREGRKDACIGKTAPTLSAQFAGSRSGFACAPFAQKLVKQRRLRRRQRTVRRVTRRKAVPAHGTHRRYRQFWRELCGLSEKTAVLTVRSQPCGCPS